MISYWLQYICTEQGHHFHENRGELVLNCGLVVLRPLGVVRRVGEYKTHSRRSIMFMIKHLLFHRIPENDIMYVKEKEIAISTEVRKASCLPVHLDRWLAPNISSLLASAVATMQTARVVYSVLSVNIFVAVHQHHKIRVVASFDPISDFKPRYFGISTRSVEKQKGDKRNKQL